MNNEEEKKSKLGLIIIIIIILLLLLFAVWYFLIRDKGESNTNNNSNNTEEKKEEPKDNKTINYDYRVGVLNVIKDENGNPIQTDFVIDGIILIGNRHDYTDRDDTKEVIEYFEGLGYKKEGINSSFYLGEWIEMYIDTKYASSESDVKILITPHKTVEELEKLSLSQLEELANDNGGYVIEYKTPEADNHKYVGNGYVNPDSPEGKYDILFTYKGKLAYFINIDLIKEPVE